jgi:hypothetical protein
VQGILAALKKFERTDEGKSCQIVEQLELSAQRSLAALNKFGWTDEGKRLWTVGAFGATSKRASLNQVTKASPYPCDGAKLNGCSAEADRGGSITLVPPWPSLDVTNVDAR